MQWLRGHWMHVRIQTTSFRLAGGIKCGMPEVIEQYDVDFDWIEPELKMKLVYTDAAIHTLCAHKNQLSSEIKPKSKKKRSELPINSMIEWRQFNLGFLWQWRETINCRFMTLQQYNKNEPNEMRRKKKKKDSVVAVDSYLPTQFLWRWDLWWCWWCPRWRPNKNTVMSVTILFHYCQWFSIIASSRFLVF